MAEAKTKRRQRHGSAWYWKQTDCWYYTPPGTKQRQPLLDEQGNRLRGQENKQAAQLALARVRLKQGLAPASESATVPAAAEAWLVARVCSHTLFQLGFARRPRFGDGSGRVAGAPAPSPKCVCVVVCGEVAR